MAIEPYSGLAAVAGSTVNVFLAGTQQFATIFADALGTPLANPFTADEYTGQYLFYAEQDSYDVTIEMPDVSPTVAVPAPAMVIFNGESPSRVATLLTEDPVTDQQIILAQVMY